MSPDERPDFIMSVRFETSDFGLQDADCLAGLAGSSGSARERQLLCASAAIVLAAGLERAIDGTLLQVAHMVRADRVTHSLDIDDLIHGSTRSKMMQAPTVMSRGALELRRGTPELHSLHRLITQRNALVHLRDDVFVYENPPQDQRLPDSGVIFGSEEVVSPSTDAAVEPEMLAMSLSAVGLDGVVLRVPAKIDIKDPWKDVGPDDVERFRAAVSTYVKDCLSPGYGALLDGALLRRAAGP